MGKSSAHSVAEPSAGARRLAGAIVVAYALVTMIPLVWILLTGFKTPPDSISYPPKVVFEPSLEGYVNLFTNRSRQTPEYMASLPPPAPRDLVRPAGPQPQHGHHRAVAFRGPLRQFRDHRVRLDLLAVFLGTLTAYAFSRFRVPLQDDLLFFILSTRMMPPIAVAIPIFLMFRELGLSDTHLGMILLYTAVNMSLSVWLLKGSWTRSPGSTRKPRWWTAIPGSRRFFKVVLPQATTGIAATAIFCLIFAWNEYAFALLLTSGEAQTAPPLHPHHHRGGRPRLAGGRRGHHAVPAPGVRLHRHAPLAPAAGHHLRSGTQVNRADADAKPRAGSASSGAAPGRTPRRC